MNEETQEQVDNFLQKCDSVDIFGYSLGVFIAHLNHNAAEFHNAFYKFNEAHGIQFVYHRIENNMVVISQW